MNDYKFKYQFKKEDAYDIARHIGIHTKERGSELTFKTCPYCRGGNSKDEYSFAINTKTGMFKCLRATCDRKGFIWTLAQDFDFKLTNEFTRYYEKQSEYKKLSQPKEPIIPKAEAIQFLESRGISEETAKAFQITIRNDNADTLVFPIFNSAKELVNIKYRNTKWKKGDKGNKEWFEKDCAPYLFGVQTFNGNYDKFVITEGQMDAMACYESGIENCFSVLGGKNSFTWYPACYDFIEKFSEIIIFGDCEHDEITLVDGIKARFKKKIRVVRVEDYKDCKDANDILLKYGKEQVKACVDNAEMIPMNNVVDLADVKSIDVFKIDKLATGISQVDRLLYGGIPFGGVTLVSGKCGEGKLLANDTPILTRNGWKTHGELKVGDEVVGRNGEWVKVTFVFPKHFANMKVTMKNGEVFYCHENHEWVTNIHFGNGYKERTQTAKEIYEWKKGNHFHPVRLIERKPLVGEEKELFIKPYTLGAWLGDGRNKNPDICSSEQDYCVIERVLKDGYEISWQKKHKTTGVIYTAFKELRFQLQKYGMCHSRKITDKYIPFDYMVSSLEQRLELLAGLIDTDGSYDSNKGCYIYATCEPKLRDSVIELIRTFGWNCWYRTQQPRVSTSGIARRKETYLINFVARDLEIPCQIERKKNTRLKRFVYKNPIIEKIEYCEHKEGNCIEVEGGIYCIGKTLIPTHNSTLASQILVNAIYQKHKCFAYSGELPNSLFRAWMDFQVCGGNRIFDAQNRWGDKEYSISQSNRQQISNWYRGNLYIYDDSHIDGEETESLTKLIERVIIQYGVDVILLDNLMTAIDFDVVTGDDKYERQSSFMKNLARISREFNVLILLVAHKRKNNIGTNGNDEIMGSSDISNLAMLNISYEKNDKIEPEKRLCKVVKNRLFGKTETEGFILEYDERSKRIFGKNDNKNFDYGWDKTNVDELVKGKINMEIEIDDSEKDFMGQTIDDDDTPFD